MNGHKAIAARLASFAGLTALVGTRISPDVMQAPATLPAVVYSLVYASNAQGSTTDPGLAMGLFQVSSFDKTRLGARLVAAQVKAALNRWRQTTLAGVSVDDCLFQRDVDLYDATADAYQVAMDFRLYFRE